MRCAAFALAGAVYLAGCSSNAPDGDNSRASLEATTGDAPTTTAPAPTSQPPIAAITPGIRGEVSPLTADVSDLNVRVTDLGTIIDLPSDALFEFDKAELTPNAEAELRKASNLVVRAPAGTIQIIGHTDSKGDDAYNQRLSEARAQPVADWFSQQVGVRQRQFAVSGKGETAPIAPNQTASGADDPAGRAKNRRVEVVLPRP